MRGLRSTIALIVVLAGLFAYIYFVTWKQPETPAASTREKLFASVAADKIEELRVKSESGDTTTLKKQKDGWQLVAPVTAAAQESEVSGITSALTGLEITRVADENPSDLKDYGLASPRVAIDFKAEGDKDFRHLFIGEKTPTGSDLFARRNDDKRVLLIPAYQEQSLNRSTFDLRDKTVIKIDRDKVDRLEVASAGKTLELAKSGTDWKLTRPIQASADFGAVEGLIGRVQSAQMKSIVANEPTPADLKKYGLDKPSATVTLNLGSAKATLVVGGKADDGTVYARDTSKPVVVTVENSLAEDFKKGADEYRRKDLFAFRAYNANRVEITRGPQTVVFEKVKGQGSNAEEKWRRVSPSAADVDADKMSAFLSKLESMRANSFVDSTAKAGLNPPAMVVAAKFDDGKKEERVTFGKADKDVYAARSDDPGAAKVDAADFEDVNKKLDELAK